MAGLVLGTAGAVLGNLIAPGIGGQIGWALGSMAGNTLFAEKQKVEGQRLNNLNVQTNTNGLPIVKGWGTFRTAGNIIWTPTPAFTEIKNVETQGGKGGPEVETTNYSYTLSVAIAIHDGEIGGIRRVWANKKLGADFSTTNTGAVGNLAKYMRVYKGTEFQEPDSLIQQTHGAYTPAFRGIAYVIFENLPLEEYGNQPPQFEFEVIRKDGALTNQDLNIVPVDNFTDSTADFFSIYENTANNHLYSFLLSGNVGGSIYVQKINQDSLTVVNQAKITLSSASIPGGYEADPMPADQYRRPVANDSLGNLYWTSGRQASFGYLNFQINKFDKDTLARTRINIYDFSGPSDPFAPLKTNINIQGSQSLYNIQGTNIMTCFGDRLLTGNTTGLYIYNFDVSTAFYSSNAGTYALTQSQIYSYIKSDYHKTQNRFYFITYIGGVETAPILNSASLTGSVMTVNENLMRLFNDGLNHRMIEIRIDHYRNKAYVFSYNPNDMPNSVAKITIQKVNLNTYTIENTITIYNPNYYCSNAFACNFVENRIVIYAQENSFNGYDVKKHTLYLDDFSLVTKDYTYAQFQNLNIKAGFDVPSSDSVNKAVYSNYMAAEVFAAEDADTTKNYLIVNSGNRYEYATYKLSNLVKEICVEAGLQETDIDTTELQLIDVKGFKRDAQQTARQLLETLAVYYNFDGVESAGKLKFVLRGKDPVKTIDYYELGAKFYSIPFDDSNVFKTQRIPENELPKKLNIIYYDIEKDYEQNTQESKRVINTTENINTIQAPIVFNSSEAKKIVDRIMYQTYISRDKYQFELNCDYAQLEPTDVIDLIKDNNTYRMRLLKVDKSQGIIKVEAEAEQKTVYSQYGVGSAGTISQDVVTTYAGTNLYILDIPIFDISDNNGGNYVVVDKESVGTWRGAAVYKSDTVNGTYSAQESIYTNTITGSVSAIFDSNHQLNTVDYISSFTITTTGQIYSISYEELLNGGNVCLIGNEIVQFMNAQLIAANTYKISGLLRGRWGTEQYINTHLVNERFILFNFYNSSLKRINKNDYMYGVGKYYKAVTLRNQISDSTGSLFTNNAIGLKPLAVVNVIGNRNSSGDLYVEFKKRVRGQAVFTNTPDITDVDGDYYEIDIFNGSTKVRTIYATALNFTYTSAEQIADFGSNQSSVLMKIYKINTGYGRGFEKSITL